MISAFRRWRFHEINVISPLAGYNFLNSFLIYLMFLTTRTQYHRTLETEHQMFEVTSLLVPASTFIYFLCSACAQNWVCYKIFSWANVFSLKNERQKCFFFGVAHRSIALSLIWTPKLLFTKHHNIRIQWYFWWVELNTFNIIHMTMEV